MKCFRLAAGSAALLASAMSLLLPSTALATVGSSFQAYQYCIVKESAQALGKTLPNFENRSSCTSVTLAPQGGTTTVSFTPPEVMQLPPGSHLLYLRFQDNLGAWGPARAQRFTVTGPKSITVGKYFIDSDGDPSAAAGSNGYAAEVPVANLLGKGGWKLATDTLAPGKHTLLIYLQDSTGLWGPSRRYTFYTAAKPTISAGRFFVSAPDTLPADYLAALSPPATADLASQGRPLNGVLGTASATLSGVFTPPPTLDYGLHTVYGLFRDSSGRWTKGWLDPAGTSEMIGTTLFVGNRLSVSATDSDGSHLGRDGGVLVTGSLWPGLSYTTPMMGCSSASQNCTDVYPNGAILSLTATPKPWIDKTPVWTGCSSILADGSCRVTMDMARSVSLRFVDSVPPDTVINSGPLQMVNIQTASFAFGLASASVEDSFGSNFRCLLDGDSASDGSFAACTSPKSFASLAEGVHTFYVKAVDKAGNQDASPASYSWTIDLARPTVTAFTMPPTSRTLSVAVGFFSAMDNIAVTGYLLSESQLAPALNAIGWSASAPTGYHFDTAGSKTLYAWVKDAAGNVSFSKSATISVDIVAPTVSSFSAPADWNSLTVPLTLNCNDDVAVNGYFVAESADPPAATASGWSYPAPPSYTFAAAGTKTLYLWAKDLAGNVSALQSAKLSVDVTPPAVDSFSIPPLSNSLTVGITSFSASDNIAVTGYFLGENSDPPLLTDSKWSLTAPTSYRFAGAGSKTLYAWVRDAAGNLSALKYAPVSVDITAPSVDSFTVPHYSKSLIVSFTTLAASDNVAVTGYSVGESASAPALTDTWSANPPGSYTFLSAGVKTLYAWARDAAGNLSPAKFVKVTVDTTSPTVDSFALQASDGSPIATVTSFLASDNLVVTGYLLSESNVSPDPGSSAWTTTVPANYTFTTAGSHTLFGFVRDPAGNISAPASAAVTTTWVLAISRTGTGSGTVNSIPSGIACGSGSTAGCSSVYPGGSLILHAAPGLDSTFTGWSGACIGTADCQVTMDANKTFSATFTLAPQVKIGPVAYTTLQGAYENAADGSLIQMREGIYSGDLLGNRAVGVTIIGGYRADYSAVAGETILEGKIALGKGSISVKALKVK